MTASMPGMTSGKYVRPASAGATTRMRGESSAGPGCFVRGCYKDGVARSIRVGPGLELRVIFCDPHRVELEAWSRRATLEAPPTPSKASPTPMPSPSPTITSTSTPAPTSAHRVRKSQALPLERLAYLKECPECSGPMPEQRIGMPRRRCADCAARRRVLVARANTERRSNALLTVTPRRCVICDATIPRVKGRKGNDRYCSPECQYEGRLRYQRAHRGGLKQPERSARMLLRSAKVIAPISLGRTG